MSGEGGGRGAFSYAASRRGYGALLSYGGGVYVPLLIRKYLAKRRIAWAALVAVALCTAMVLVVLSVMGGWLGMFKASFQGLTGDVIVRSSRLAGFGEYEALGRELEALPEVAAAVPVIQTFGLIDINDGVVTDAVDVVGYPMGRVGLVNEFPASLYLRGGLFDDLADGEVKVVTRVVVRDEGQPEEVRETVDTLTQAYLLTVAREAEGLGEAQRLALAAAAEGEALTEAQAEAVRAIELPATAALPLPDAFYDGLLGMRRGSESDLPGLIGGTKLMHGNSSDDGQVRGGGLYRVAAKLQVLPLSAERAAVSSESVPQQRRFWVVDDSTTGVHARDNKSVYIDFDVAQELAEMKGEAYIDAITGEERREPDRTSQLHVALTPGVELEAGRAAVQRAVDSFVDENHATMALGGGGMIVNTWEDVTGGLVAQVEKETVLVTFLMGMISLVAVVLIFCIFYMIVVEKTRDIGILKSVGATGRGVATIFLGYGAGIGIVGGAAGLLLGSLVVWNINHIHDALTAVLGVKVYNAQFYLFELIPNDVEPRHAAGVFAAAVVASVVGSVLPAVRAARLRPVEALRFE